MPNQKHSEELKDAPDWSTFPINIISHFVQVLKEEQWWQPLGRKCRLLNKHWCHSINQHIHEVNPDETRRVCATEVIQASSQHFSNLQELNLRGCFKKASGDDLPREWPGLNVKKLTLTCGKVKEVTKSLLTCTSLTHISLHNVTSDGDLFQDLARLPLLASLELRAMPQLSNDTFAQLMQLPNLTYLSLDRCRDLGGASLATMAAWRPHLKTLKLLHCRGFTDKSMVFLKPLTTLTRLELASERVTDAGLANLASLTDLAHLELQTPYSTFSSLKSLTTLACFKFHSGFLLKDDHWRHMTHLMQLTELSLDGFMRVTDMGMECLGALTNLRKLSVTKYARGYQLSIHGLSTLGNLTKLKELKLMSSPLSRVFPCNWDFLLTLTALEDLNLSGANLGRCADDFTAFENLNRLTALVLGPLVTEQGLDEICKMVKLKTLELVYCQALKDGALSALHRLTDLKNLSLNCCTEIGDRGMRHVAQMKSLVAVDLRGCNAVTHNGLKRFAALPLLSKLTLSIGNKTGMERSGLTERKPELLVVVE